MAEHELYGQVAQDDVAGLAAALAAKADGGHTHGPAAPAAHASTHASGGSDPVTPADIGAAPSAHTHTRKYTVTDVTGAGQSVQLATNSGQYDRAVWSAATADATMLAPTDMSVGDLLVVFVRAVSAQRIITPSGFIASADFSTAARTIASGKTGVFTLACVNSGVMVSGYQVQA